MIDTEPDAFDYDEFSKNLNSPELRVQRDVAAIYDKLDQIHGTLGALLAQTAFRPSRWMIVVLLAYIAYRLTP